MGVSSNSTGWTCLTVQQDSEDATTAPMVKLSEADCYCKTSLLQNFSFGDKLKYKDFQHWPLPVLSLLQWHYTREATNTYSSCKKSCLSGIILFCSEGGARYQSVPWSCNYAAETVLLSNLACFLDLPQVNLCCSLGCSCQYRKCKQSWEIPESPQHC